MELVRSLFSKHILQAYIADSITGQLLLPCWGQENYLHDNDDDQTSWFVMCIFPFDDLTIFDFNRVVDITMSETRFIASLSVFLIYNF
ncbi:MAG: hypothetical protein IPL08_19855 [Saprospiraceae bacterium]|nr:hypothetical protein [Saprospiraceae bacterium]